MSFIDWLPELVVLEECKGHWENYLELIYQHFVQDFCNSRPEFHGTKLALKRHPVVDGKEATFWHIISEGSNEADRVPDLRRCERIRWPKPTIENDTKPEVKVWENQRDGEKRILIWVEPIDYLVVLAERKGYILLWTAFCVTREHQKAKYRKEYEAFKRASAAN